ncbi:MAG TPA: hypothetical protein VK501_11780 [Baekduia sp.]|uniref:hypothetical protein n=1 Tax=Baekduia sp. TaxID=2600305 RepID=UPI002C0304E3|nr:hypothetical protein [Baekduia sp.]HMJ34588.1 hypothetical protein [Baekduia sp.]
MVSTGFGDTDEPEGRAREDALLAEVRAHGLRLVGPNALGVVNTDPAVSLQALIGRVPVRAGGLGLSSQSGALGLALLGHAAGRRIGVSSFLALGNRADVSTNDVLEHFADDERTTVVAFYVESFGNPRRFPQVARRVSRRKPILAVKGSRRDADAAPGKLRIAAALTDAAATEALLHQAGVLGVESTQTLFDAAELLERQPRRSGTVRRPGEGGPGRAPVPRNAEPPGCSRSTPLTGSPHGSLRGRGSEARVARARPLQHRAGRLRQASARQAGDDLGAVRR